MFRSVFNIVVLMVMLAVFAPGVGECGQTGRWVGNTSGPFFTGTADVEPFGSFYYEPYWFETLPRNTSNTSLYMPQKLAIGLGYNSELDLIAPFEYNTAPGVGYLGYGDTQISLKYQFTKERDRYRLFALPSQAILFNLMLPTGKYDHLEPERKGADQTGTGTWGEGFGYLLRKQVKPFMLYVQLTETILNPARVHGGYTFNNNMTEVPFGESLNMIDGNLLSYSAAIEHVLYPPWGFGYVLEAYGQWQSGYNPIFGHASAPSWNFLWLVPAVEIAWPQTRNFATTWGVGAAIPVAQHDYLQAVVPLATVSFYFNFGGAR